MNLDKELDSFVNEELQKDITQEDSISPDVGDKLKEMGFLWSKVQDKLIEDGTCFHCKKQVDFSGGIIRVLEASKTDKGVIAFVSVCQNCFTILEEEENKKNV